MENLENSFLLASGKLQALCYKADIEAALRTPKFGGFQLLDLHDFPGQGTALVGVLDPFWEEKGYISPEEYRRFCNSTVPLARLKKRIFKEGENLSAQIEVAHYGATPLSQLDSFSADLRPIVRIIDDWVSNRRLALLFEAKVGNGSILVSGVNLVSKLDSRPEAVQLKRSLLIYMNGDQFKPEVELEVVQINRIMKGNL